MIDVVHVKLMHTCYLLHWLTVERPRKIILIMPTFYQNPQIGKKKIN